MKRLFAKLTPRQRVWRALHHQEVDRVPIDLVGKMSREGNGFYHKGLWERFELDFRRISLRGLERFPLATPWKTRPRARDSRLGDRVDHAWPAPHALGRIEGLEAWLERLYVDTEYALRSYVTRWMPLVKREAEELHHRTNYALIGAAPLSGFLQQGVALWGFAEFMTALIQDKGRVKRFWERIYRTTEAFYGMFLSQVGQYLQVVEIGDDVGMKDSLIISPSLYREMLKPYHKRLIAFIKRRTPAKVLFHSCGAIFDIIGDLTEIGVDILSPIQASCRGMDIQSIKQQYGKALCLHGGLDDEIVYAEDALRVKGHVEKTLLTLSPGGGYILGIEHDLRNPLPERNLRLILDTALNFNPHIQKARGIPDVSEERAKGWAIQASD